MLSSFRAVLARPGAWPLAIACLLGWFSAIGTALAVVLAVHHATGSFALAGAASATQAIASAVFAPLRGRLVDRHGSAGLLTILAGLLVGTAVFVWGCLDRVDPIYFAGVAFMGGFALPLIGVARARWPVVAGGELVATAHALNAATSDCAQLGAPTLVAGVSLALSPLGALVVLVGGATLAAILLIRLGIPRQESEQAGQRDFFGVVRGNSGLQAIIIGDLGMGAWSAGMTIVVVAIAARHGHAALGGLLLAAGALGSVVMSVLAGSGVLRARIGTRYVTGAGISAAGLLLLLLSTALPTVAVAMVIVGAGLGLENVAVFQALDAVSPTGHSTEAFTWLTTSSAAGAAIGAALSGQLIHHSTMAARIFLLIAALIVATVLFFRRGEFDIETSDR
jgi:hypothetical protein